jgi:predicted Zn-dependent peptidase
MTTRITTLSNGLRVATCAMEHLETVSLGLWVQAGARHEADGQHGLSHLLEHMAFKGTARRTARQIAEEIEEVGGELNAATGLDSTAYYARVLKGDEAVALEILADILLNSTFDPSDLEREREVIIQEIASANDSPDDVAFDLLHAAAFPDQPLGLNILGTPESVAAMQAADLKAFLQLWYRPEAMVVAAAGAVHHENLVRHVEALFGGLTPGDAGEERPARYRGGALASDKPFEQSHVLIGFESPSYLDDEFYTAQVFSGLFGGGMSSRLFQEIRENRGLCYSIYSTVWGLRDVGMFAVHAATGSKMIGELSTLIARELESVAAHGPTERELQRAKAQIKSGLLMALESSSVRAEQMGRHLLNYGRVIGPEELARRVTAIDGGAIKAFAGKLSAAVPTVAVVGSGKSSLKQAKEVAQTLTRKDRSVLTARP